MLRAKGVKKADNKCVLRTKCFLSTRVCAPANDLFSTAGVYLGNLMLKREVLISVHYG